MCSRAPLDDCFHQPAADAVSLCLGIDGDRSHSRDRAALVEKLASILPNPLKKVFLLTTGSETVECAIKLCRTHGTRAGGRSKNVIVNRVLNEAGELCCEIRATFVWLDLAARKITPPPEALRAAMESLERTEDFAEL